MYEYGGAVTHPTTDDVELEMLLGLLFSHALRDEGSDHFGDIIDSDRPVMKEVTGAYEARIELVLRVQQKGFVIFQILHDVI